MQVMFTQRSTHVIKSRAACARSDDLDAGQRSLGKIDGRQGDLLDAQGAVSGGVQELRRQGVVEVGRVGAEAEIDEDIGPRVVQVKGE